MADQRSVMKEYRLLESKRQAGPLTPLEETRFAQLRELVGPETGVAAAKPGFDVNAAAARLRESLLPAGLRNRPAGMEPPPPPPPAPEPAPAPLEGVPSVGGLEEVWNAAPFAPLTEPGGAPADALFDPGSLAFDAPAPEAGWDPNAQPYDPNAQPYDPNAQPWDPNAQPYDPNAQAWQQPAEGWDPNAQPYDPNAQPWDPNTQPYDPNAQAWQQPAEGWDPNAQHWDAGSAGAEPAAQAYVAGEPQQWDQEATPQWDAATQQAWDPNLAPPWGEQAAAELASEPPLEAEPPAEPAAPELAQQPEEMLPFDAEAASLVGAGALPDGWGAEPAPAIEPVPEPAFPTTVHEPAELGGYGDLAGPEEPSRFERLPSDEAQGLLAPLGAGQELTSDEEAFAQGFQLASNGSFGVGAPVPAPAWGAGSAPAEGEPWESAPSLDLGAASDAALASPSADALDEIDVEEIPVVEGQELLEEIPLADALPAPPSRAPAQPPAVRVEGVHRVVVHTIDGLVKRGAITDAILDAATLPIAEQPGASPEPLSTATVKAIFFMLAPGEKAPTPAGKKVRVTFTDGRQVAGYSPDYSDAGGGFFMIPADTRTNTGRIWVYRSAVKAVAVT